ESLGEEELVARALADRAERARTEKMTVKSADSSRPWTDYAVTNRLSGKTYRVALRGTEPGDSYCSCPDFRTNTLGTCKHIMHVPKRAGRRSLAGELRRPYRRKHLALHLRYDGDEVTLRLLTPEKVDDEVARIIKPIRDQPITDLHDLLKRIGSLQKIGRD